jgi:hypothetical protein
VTGPERPLDGAAPDAGAFADLTQVDLTWVEKRVEQWLRFGTPARERRIDRRRRVLSFTPGVTFALVRWASNDIGTVLSRLDIVRTTEQGAACQTLPLVRPGGEILLRAEGWPKLERVLRHIDTIEAAGIDLAAVDPDHWRHVHNRMAAGQEPSAYTPARHQAWLKRRRTGG